MSEHDQLCLTRSGEEPCNCDQIAECKARTHHPLCPAREPNTACRHCFEYPAGCECDLLRQAEQMGYDRGCADEHERHRMAVDLMDGVIRFEQGRCERAGRAERERIRLGVLRYDNSIDEIGGYSFDEAITAVLAIIDEATP